MQPPLYRFKGADFLPQSLVVVAPLVSGGTIYALSGDVFGWLGVMTVFAILLVVALGFSAEVIVTVDSATVVKRWFGIPYRRYSAHAVSHVSFGGDWGLTEGAVGVVVQLGKSEVHLGAPWNKQRLFNSLSSITIRHTVGSG